MLDEEDDDHMESFRSELSFASTLQCFEYYAESLVLPY